KNSKVEMVTTDGFIYPNSVLMERQILNRKGFPESYNMELLLNFLDSIKNGMTAEIPVYSHEIYDILPDEKQVIQSPDFLILEGINVFQNQKNTRLYMTGYFDFSIYIDADINNIKNGIWNVSIVCSSWLRQIKTITTTALCIWSVKMSLKLLRILGEASIS